MEIEPLEKHEDERGVLVEAFKLPNDGQVFSVVASPGETRGNHYHKRKIEKFLVVAGTATIHVRDRKTQDKMSVELTGNKPMCVTIVPDNTHSITAGDMGAVFIVWSNEIFNKKDPDTFGEEI